MKAEEREKGDLTVDESRSEGIDAVEDNETCTWQHRVSACAFDGPIDNVRCRGVKRRAAGNMVLRFSRAGFSRCD